MGLQCTGSIAPRPGQPSDFRHGLVPLQPEQSINYSLGTVVDTGPFTFTADYFRINVSDRLTITRNYSLSPDEVATLLAGGIAEAGNLAAFRFFVNDFSTRTQGLDLVATWTPLALGARTTFSGVFNFTDTEVTEFGEEHIDQDRIAALTLGLPRMRWNMGLNHAADRWTLMARLHYYGSYWDREDVRSALGGAMSYLYPLYSGKPLVDLEVGFPFSDFTLSVGAQNIFNTYPDENPGRRRRRGQPLWPVRAVRLQRRLLLHPRQLRVGRLRWPPDTTTTFVSGPRPQP